MSLAPVIAGNLIKEASNTTGVGDYQLTGTAAEGFTRFFDWFSTGQRVPVVVTDGAGGYEYGLYTYDDATDRLARTNIVYSSNAGSAVSWGSGERQLICATFSDLSQLCVQLHQIASTGSPGVNNDLDQLFDAMSFWLERDTGKLWYCVDASNAAADWRYLLTSALKIQQPATNTAGGTTGAQTINKPSGTVNFAIGASSLVVTCNQCTTASIVLPVLRTNDATARIANVVPANGSFTINLTAAATAETSCGFLVIN